MDYNLLPASQSNIQNQIKNLIETKNIILISGEPGCGKTTQIPKLILKELNKKIVCTQPRIIPTIEIAKRVAEEMNVELGNEGGDKYRQNNFTSENTMLSYVTEGTLLKEIYSDPDFSSYGAVIIDEAHERSTIIDFLLAFCREALINNAPLKVIIMSATINLEKFRDYFKFLDLGELHIPGKLFEVERIYYKPKKVLRNGMASNQDLVSLIQSLSAGDILVFLTTKKEIDKHVEQFTKLFNNYKVYPLYSGLSKEEVKNATEPDPNGINKIIFSTNVGETSLTIKGIKYVIDSGFVFSAKFCPILGGHLMKKNLISQSSSKQRTGRAGRVENGTGILMYTEKKFNKMIVHDEPQICSDDFSSELLSLYSTFKTSRKVLKFLNGLIDPPSQQYLDYCSSLLEKYKAITLKKSYSGISKLGFTMSRISAHPTQAYCILEAKKLGCENEILHLMSLLDLSVSLEDFFTEKKKLPSIFKLLRHPTGDHLTLLTIFKEYLETENPSEWCWKKKLSYSKFLTAHYVRDQLGYQTNITIKEIDLSKADNILEILERGFYKNILNNLIREYDNKKVKVGLTTLYDTEGKIIFNNICSFDKKRVVSIVSEII